MPTRSANSCTFCDIIHGAGEVSLCYEDADALAFMDIQPVNPGHVLVVPRQHFESLRDVPPELAAHLFEVATQLAGTVQQVTGSEGINLVVNSGAAAGQDVFHYHVHVIPRKADDGFDIPLPFESGEPSDRYHLDAVAAQIIAARRDPMKTGRETRSGSRGTTTQPPMEREVARPAQRRPIEREVSIRAVADAPARAPRMPEPMPVHRDDVADAAPRRWAISGEGAHGELVRELPNFDADA